MRLAAVLLALALLPSAASAYTWRLEPFVGYARVGDTERAVTDYHAGVSNRYVESLDDTDQAVQFGTKALFPINERISLKPEIGIVTTHARMERDFSAEGSFLKVEDQRTGVNFKLEVRIKFGDGKIDD